MVDTGKKNAKFKFPTQIPNSTFKRSRAVYCMPFVTGTTDTI